jgi:hypothetical protein
MREQSAEGDDPSKEPKRFTRLPERITLADTVPSHPASPPSDLGGGRDPDADFLLRYGGTG